MENEIKKKNVDYSNSAVNLVNPDSVKIGLDSILILRDKLIEVQAKINECIPAELTLIENNLKAEMDRQITDLKGYIELDGSYQDLDRGWYAVKQRKVSKSYDAAVFKLAYPLYAPAVIIETMDTVKLGGLIKGGLIKEADLKTNGVVEEKETFNYIIKVG